MTNKIQICIRIRQDLNSELQEVAMLEDVSKNKLIERELKKIVKQYFEKTK